MRKVLMYSVLVLMVSAAFGSCGLFKGKKERCPAYSSVDKPAADDLALNK